MKNNLKDVSGTSKTMLDNHNELLCAVGRDRDRKAFIALFEYYAPRVKSFLMNNKINADTAEELTQDVFVKLWRKAHMYDPDKAGASTWIFTIARNRRIDFIRKHSRLSYEEDDLLMSLNDAEQDGDEALDFIDQKQKKQILKEALKELPEEQSLLLRKSFFDNKSHSEIAQEIQLPLGTVKSRIRLAMNKLRGLLNKDDF